MVRFALCSLIAASVTACATSDAQPPQVKAQLGKAAPTFALPDLAGQTHRLEDHRGKVTILEWFNPDCPYVKYAHGSGPLKDQAARLTAAGVDWIAINSGSPGKQGHGVERNREAVTEWSLSHPVLIDEDGSVGRAYGAKTTPHMYVINEDGVLVYQGAIDNAPFGKASGTTKNFVDLALADLKAGNAVETADTKPYGCSVKY